MDELIVEMKNIKKSFPGVLALRDAGFSLRKGEVHALVGENGAGKSTLIKILTGAYTADEGEILIDGKRAVIRSPIDARKNGIFAVYQDITLAMHLSVGENFFLGDLPKNTPLTVDWKKIRHETEKALQALNLDIDPDMILRDLPIAKQEMVAIAKAFYYKAKVIIFDEPTALLANEETEELFGIIAKLKEKGVGIIYISHRLEEIFRVCDRVTVLKDGMYVTTKDCPQTNENELVKFMVGRTIAETYSIDRNVKPETVMSVSGLSCEGLFRDVSFELRKGEILGMFGLVGAGRSEIAQTIFGAIHKTAGTVTVGGRQVEIKKPRDAIALGIGLLPENRRVQGLATPLTIRENANLVVYPDISTFGVIHLTKEKRNAESNISRLAIKTPSIEQRVRNLSGGNQQKVVIGKWLNTETRVLIFDEPTVGVDVGAKTEIYKILESLTATGNSIILISSYLPEVIGLSDRVIVVHEGKQMAIVDKVEATEERILALASGIDGLKKTARETQTN